MFVNEPRKPNVCFASAWFSLRLIISLFTYRVNRLLKNFNLVISTLSYIHKSRVARDWANLKIYYDEMQAGYFAVTKDSSGNGYQIVYYCDKIADGNHYETCSLTLGTR